MSGAAAEEADDSPADDDDNDAPPLLHSGPNPFRPDAARPPPAAVTPVWRNGALDAVGAWDDDEDDVAARQSPATPSKKARHDRKKNGAAYRYDAWDEALDAPRQSKKKKKQQQQLHGDGDDRSGRARTTEPGAASSFDKAQTALLRTHTTRHTA